MATETLTAVQALDEVLNHLFGGWPPHGWRDQLALANEAQLADSEQTASGSAFTFGDLRRWAAPLLATEG